MFPYQARFVTRSMWTSSSPLSSSNPFYLQCSMLLRTLLQISRNWSPAVRIDEERFEMFISLVTHPNSAALPHNNKLCLPHPLFQKPCLFVLIHQRRFHHLPTRRFHLPAPIRLFTYSPVYPLIHPFLHPPISTLLGTCDTGQVFVFPYEIPSPSSSVLTSHCDF